MIDDKRGPLATGGEALSTHGAKVAQVTLAFWVIKIVATTLGETGGDVLSMTLHLGYALSTVVFFGIFVIAVSAQVSARMYRPFLYWTVILATTTAGTTMSDYLDRTAGLGYIGGSALLVTILVSILALWRFTLGSVSVNNIVDRKVEVFYWTTILFSNTLGTALGDFAADSAGLGYEGGALVFSGLLALIAAAYFFTKAPRTILFWLAFILTRPLGATVGDLLTKTHAKGGLELGTIPASLVLTIFLVAAIVVTSRRALHNSPAAMNA
ncbi:MAG TPA: hypothetical protein PKX06_06195 [Phenylobacterium sp.]|nr:hypothetical protein [Phenylobacterium sp.]